MERETIAGGEKGKTKSDRFSTLFLYTDWRNFVGVLKFPSKISKNV